MAASLADRHAPRSLKRGLTLRFSALLFLFLALLGGVYLAVSSAVAAKEYDSIKTNLAGRQRMLTQKYAREINQVLFGLAVSDWEMTVEMKEAASRTAELYDVTLTALLNGGVVDIGIERRTRIPALRDAAIVEQLERVRSEWEELRRNAIKAMRSDNALLSRNDYVRVIHWQTNRAVAEMDYAVSLLQKQSEARLRRVGSYMTYACILGVVLFLVTLVFVRSRIVAPLDRSMTALETEITERKRAEDELRKLSVAVEQSPATVVITDTEGTIQYVNPRFTEATGYSAEEAIGQNPRILKSGDMSRDAYRQMWETIRAGDVWRGEFHNRKKNGELHWEAASVSPIRDSNGVVTHFLAVKEDITERKRVEEELRQARDAADAANKAKSDFLANMSHEIRTPMTAMLGYIEQIADGCPQKCEYGRGQIRNDLGTISRNADLLLRIINDILDLSKIEAGKMTVRRIACKPCEMIADIASLMRTQADGKGLAFDIEYVGAIPETIQTDPTRLRQILINLLGNAIKFTETGSVRLLTRLVRHAKGDQGGSPKASYMQFDVLDTGLGMSEEQVTRLFQAFMQADTSATRKAGGTGLGLVISKRFAEMLGGDITVVETREGVGTRFRLTIATGPLDGAAMIEDPISATVVANASDGVARALPSDLHGVRILLAEDAPDNKRLISFVLKKVGADVTVVENGQLAVERAMGTWLRRRENDPVRPFDVILMDMQMPVMDGYEATRVLRRRGYTGQIIALTAHAMEGDREKCIEAGCDDYATKPIDRKKLIETIQRHGVSAKAVSSVPT